MKPSKRACVAFGLLVTALVGWASVSWSRDDAPKAPARPAVGVQLGANASLGGRRVFPADNSWNVEIAHIPADPSSDAYIASIGAEANLHPDFGTTFNGQPWGIPYVVVPGDQPRLPVNFEYAEECDQCLYPIPPDAPIEGGPDSDGDRHM